MSKSPISKGAALGWVDAVMEYTKGKPFMYEELPDHLRVWSSFKKAHNCEFITKSADSISGGVRVHIWIVSNRTKKRHIGKNRSKMINGQLFDEEGKGVVHYTSLKTMQNGNLVLLHGVSCHSIRRGYSGKIGVWKV